MEKQLDRGANTLLDDSGFRWIGWGDSGSDVDGKIGGSGDKDPAERGDVGGHAGHEVLLDVLAHAEGWIGARIGAFGNDDKGDPTRSGPPGVISRRSAANEGDRGRGLAS